MNPTKKRLVLLLAGLFLLAWLVPPEAIFYVCYYDRAAATVYLDGKAVFQVENKPFQFLKYTARLRPGIHTLAVRQGKNGVTSRFLYLHVNSTVVEYTRHEHDSGHTWYARVHLGKFQPD